MKKKNKPTEEELDTKIQEAIDMGEGKDKVKTQKEKDAEALEAHVQEKLEAEKKEKEGEPKKKAKPTKEEQEEIDRLKKENAASARENQKTHAKNRIINKAIVESDSIPEPTEEELKTEYGDKWEKMSDVEKGLAKETVISKKFRATIQEAQKQGEKIEKWGEDVATFIENPVTLNDNPELEGKTEEFKEFASTDENNNVPMKLLVSAFLHDNSSKVVKNKGKMFESGSGGPNDKGKKKSNKLSLDESRALRNSDYNLWKEKLDAGQIEFDVD